LGEGRLRVSDIGGKGQAVDEVYSLRKKDPPRKNRKGEYFFSILVGDSTGDIRVNYWGKGNEAQVRAVFDSIKEGGMVRVRGTTDVFQDNLVVQVNPSNGHAVEDVPEGDYDLSCFVPTTEKDPEAMFAEMMSYVKGIEDPYIRELLERLFFDGTLVQQFKTSPASVDYHCAWIGGLLEHTLNVLRTCDFISRLYSELDRDLLLASAILHDIGKVRCYKVTTSITESVEGRLRGHITIGAQMVEDMCTRIDGFPEPLLNKLVHMVLASHGSREKGSPTEPCIPEALALNYADELDARLERFIRARDNGGPEDLFVMDWQLKTKVYLG
jgi:3'-5' exoribonuclease